MLNTSPTPATPAAARGDPQEAGRPAVVPAVPLGFIALAGEVIRHGRIDRTVGLDDNPRRLFRGSAPEAPVRPADERSGHQNRIQTVGQPDDPPAELLPMSVTRNLDAE